MSLFAQRDSFFVLSGYENEREFFEKEHWSNELKYTMEKNVSQSKKIEELLDRGVEEIIDRSHLETKLKSGKITSREAWYWPNELQYTSGR